jgi:hypothetical protein
MLRIIISVIAITLFVACGQSDPAPITAPVAPPAPAAPGAPTTPVAVPSWTDVAAIIQANCGKCHNGVKEPAFTSGAVFKASTAKAELTSGAMPQPPNVISASDKAALLAYLNAP